MLLLTDLDANIVACSRRLQTWYFGSTPSTGRRATALAAPLDHHALDEAVDQLAAGHRRTIELAAKISDVRGHCTDHRVHIVRLDHLLAWHLTWPDPTAGVGSSAAIWVSPLLDQTSWHGAPAAIAAIAGHLFATFPEHAVTFDGGGAYVTFDDSPTTIDFEQRMGQAARFVAAEHTALCAGDLCGVHIAGDGSVTSRIDQLVGSAS